MPLNNFKGARKLSELANPPPAQRSLAVPGALASYNSQRAFIKLPLELHLKIVSYFTVLPDAVIMADAYRHLRSEDSPDYLARFRVLLALSRTCQALRTLYLPLAWERLQAVIASGPPPKWENDLAIRLQIQSEGLMTKSTYLLPLVK